VVAEVPGVTVPRHTSDEDLFWRGVAEGRLLITRCAGCSTLQHPPSPMCPVCGSVRWTAEEMSGRGKVHSWIVSRHPTESDDHPRIVALVELDEGVRLVSNLKDVDPDQVTNDMEVEVLFTEVDGFEVHQFRPCRQSRPVRAVAAGAGRFAGREG
jgi:uncharacterized OB-fold protein